MTDLAAIAAHCAVFGQDTGVVAAGAAVIHRCEAILDLGMVVIVVVIVRVMTGDTGAAPDNGDGVGLGGRIGQNRRRGMAVGAGIVMDNHRRLRVVAIVIMALDTGSRLLDNDIGLGMAAMLVPAVVMAVKAADGQQVILDDPLHTRVSVLKGARIRGVIAGGVMAGTAEAKVQRIDACPGVGVAMAGVTGRRTRQIAGPGQHRMGAGVMLAVASKVRRMAGGAFSASRVDGGAASQYAGTGGVTGGAGRMYLAATHKRCRGRHMAAGGKAVDRGRGANRRHLY